MPRINAASVREHREQVSTALVDAAERILRESGDTEALTAGAVATEAGIARNSIYRYVDSVDDLRGLVLARYLPQWGRAVAEAVAGVEDPAERIVVWSRANLEQAATSGHGWLMAVARGARLSADTKDAVDKVHDPFADDLVTSWGQVNPERAQLGVELVRGMVDAGFRRLDAGEEPAEVVRTVAVAVAAVVDVLGA